MNSAEFKSIMAHFEARFPDVSKWLRSSTDPKATMEAWQQAWKGIDAECCKAAIDQIFTGQTPYPEPWSKFPATIIMIARSIKYQTAKQRELREQPERQIPERSRHSMSAMLGCVRDCVTAGMSTNEALETVNKKFPLADEDRHRYRCLDCEDTGHVRIFHNRTASALWHRAPVVRKYSAIVLCPCQAGDKRRSVSGAPIEVTYIAIYDPEKFCRYGNGDMSILQEWIDRKREMAVAAQGDLPF